MPEKILVIDDSPDIHALVNEHLFRESESSDLPA
jgi:hypothetical protein